MSITLFGTCRIDNINYNNNLNNLLNYSHSTKEVIQFIKFLKGELNFPEPYNKLCFRTAICEDKYIEYNDSYNKLFLDTHIFIIEICSNKKYIHNNFYLHHLCVDERFKGPGYNNTPPEILNNFTIEKQSDEEIENDILEIQKLLHPKIIIIVSHYNSKQNGKVLNSRNNLINLLDTICKKYNIPFINPTIVLSNYSQEEVMKEDLGHYTDFGSNKFVDYVNKILSF
jgi:hypothetical protein